GRVEAAEPFRRQLAIELGDVLLEHRPLELQAEVLDLHLEEASRLRRGLLERGHGGHGTGFGHLPRERHVRTGRPKPIYQTRATIASAVGERNDVTGQPVPPT